MHIPSSLRREGWLFDTAIFLGITGLAAYAFSKFASGKLIVIITAVGLIGFLILFSFLVYRINNLKHVLIAIAITLAAVIAGNYLILFGFLYFFQDTVADQTSSFFQPKIISAETADALAAPDVLPLDLTTPEGIHLRGWLVRNAVAEKTPLLIYFGGSGSEVSEIIPFAQELDGWSVALVNYRGFGLSEGTPTHANALADALFIYDLLVKRQDIDSKRAVSMGYSLGTGVAVYLSRQRPTIGTILVSPYDHWSLIGLKQSPLYAPLSGLMKPYFDSIARAPGVNTPLLCLIGTDDRIVPPNRSLDLANAWGGESKVISYPGQDHGLLFHNNSSWTDILAFLKDVGS